MQNSQEINWGLEIAKIAIPSLIALVAPIVTGFVLAKKLKNYESNLSADLKSYELSLNRKLEEHKNELSDKSARLSLVMDNLADLYTKVSQFRAICTDYAQNVLLMSAKGYNIDEYKNLVATTIPLIAEMDSKIGLYAKEAEKEFGEMVLIAEYFKKTCSEYLTGKEDNCKEIEKSLGMVMEACNKILKIIEIKSSEYLDVGKLKTNK